MSTRQRSAVSQTTQVIRSGRRAERSTKACPDAQCAAPERSSRIPRIPTATPNKRPPNIRTNPPAQVSAGGRRTAAGDAPACHSERHRPGDRKRRGSSGDGGNDTEYDGGAGGIDGRGIACTLRAQTCVSVTGCAHGLFETRHACVGGHGRAHLGLRRRSCRSGRPSEPSSEAGTHRSDGQGCTLESTHPLGSATMR
jgi:hypothetical protein